MSERRLKVKKERLETNDSIDGLVTRYSEMVYKLAFARTRNRYDADDIFQEVFMRYIKKRPVFNNKEHEKAWFIKVTVNCSNSLFSSWWQKNTKVLTDDIVFELPEDQSLFEELGKLPLKYREVVHLFYFEDLSTKEIAIILGRKESTVRTQLTRARQNLKAFIKEEDDV